MFDEMRKNLFLTEIMNGRLTRATEIVQLNFEEKMEGADVDIADKNNIQVSLC